MKLKVLWVDDELWFVEEMLKLAPKKLLNRFELDTAEDLENAIKMITEKNYDIVITDGYFPDKQGEETKDNGEHFSKITMGKRIVTIGLSADPQVFKSANYRLYKWGFANVLLFIDDLLRK